VRRWGQVHGSGGEKVQVKVEKVRMRREGGDQITESEEGVLG
jgi:hypothetical protein